MPVTWLSSPLLTPRLVLRPMMQGDEEPIAALFSNGEVRRHLGGALSIEEANGRAAGVGDGATERFWGHFAVVEQSTNVVIGMAGFDDQRGRWQLNYEFSPEWWGRGLAREAVAAILAWFWSQRPDVGDVIAVTQAANVRSCRLLEHLGGKVVREFEEFGAAQREYELRRGRLGFAWGWDLDRQTDRHTRLLVPVGSAQVRGRRPADLRACRHLLSLHRVEAS